MTELILIRHGETDWNRELRFQGQLDVPLNAVGLEQARRVALRLEREPFHGLVSSDLQRARQTAALLAEGHLPGWQQAPELEAGLREQHFGLAEGLRASELKAQHAAAWEAWLRFDADFAFEGGESTRAFHARVLAAIQTLVQRHGGQTVALVTHGGVLDMVYRSALGLPLSGPRQSDIPNAGLNRVRVADGRIEILEWADTRHLVGLPLQPVYEQRPRPPAAATPADESA